MRKFLIITAFLLIPVSAAYTQNPAEPAKTSPEQAELARLDKEMSTAYKGARYDEAINIAQRILALDAKVNGPDGKASANAYFCLGASYNQKEKYSEAADNLQRSLDIYVKKYPAEKGEILDLYNLLGLVFYHRGDNKKAEKMLLQAVALSEELHGPNSRETLEYVGNLSTIYRNLGDNIKGEAYMHRAKIIAGKVYGKESPDYETYFDAYECYANNVYDEKLAKAIKERNAAEAAANASTDVRVNGKIISLVKPESPALVSDKYPTKMIVKVKIDEAGNVIAARVLCGDRRYEKVSLDAALATKFAPSTLNGTPISIVGVMVYNFNVEAFLKTGLVNQY